MKNYLKMILIASSITGLVCGANDIENMSQFTNTPTEDRFLQEAMHAENDLRNQISEHQKNFDRQTLFLQRIHDFQASNPKRNLDSEMVKYEKATQKAANKINDTLIEMEQLYDCLSEAIRKRKEAEKAKHDRIAELLKQAEDAKRTEMTLLDNSEDDDYSSDSSSWSLRDENDDESSDHGLPDEDYSISAEEDSESEEEIVSILHEQRPANRTGWFSRFLNFFHRQPAVEQQRVTTSIEE